MENRGDKEEMMERMRLIQGQERSNGVRVDTTEDMKKYEYQHT